MCNIIMKVIKHPDRIVPHLIARIKQLQVSKVEENGKLFFKYKDELYPDYLNNGNACQFISEKALPYCKGKGIDIGADKWPLPGAVPVRDEQDMNAYSLGAFTDNSLDYVFSSHCVEHLDSWEEALLLWISKLKIGGILFLYLPHESMKLWNPMGPWVGSKHKWKPTHEILLPFLSKHGIEIIEYNPDRDKYWSFYIVGKRVST